MCIRCYVATKFHYSFAASQQLQPFLLRLWWVTNPCTANATTRITRQYKRHTTAVTGLKHGRACKPKRYHTALGTRARCTIHIPDRHTRYDITPYATYYDAVTGRRFYFWMDTSRTTVLTVVLCFWNTFYTAMALYCPKVEWTVEDRFVLERGKTYYCKKLKTASQEWTIFQRSVCWPRNIINYLLVAADHVSARPPVQRRRVWCYYKTKNLHK